LSVRWKYGGSSGRKKATISALDQNGKLFERGASGILAQVFQHETDHLDGALFIDKARDIHDLPPEEIKKIMIKFAFFGSSEFSIYVLDVLKTKGFLPTVNVTTPDKPKGRGLALTPTLVKLWSIKNNIPVLDRPSSILVLSNN